MAQQAAQKAVNPIHYVIVVALSFGFAYLPPFAALTPYGMGILGSFLGAIWGWLTIGMLWPSLIAIVGLGMTVGFMKMMAAVFGSLPFVLLLLCFGTVGVAMKNGAFVWLVNKMLGNKLMQGRPWITMWVLMLISIVGGILNPIIMVIIICSFLTAMLKEGGVTLNDKLAVVMYIGCAFCAGTSQVIFPFRGTGFTILQAYYTMFPNIHLNQTGYMVFMIFMSLLMSVVFVLVARFVIRADAKPLKEFCPQCNDEKITKDQKSALLLFFGFFAICAMTALPLGIVTVVLNKITVVGLCILGGCVGALMKAEDGSPLCDLEELYHMCNFGQAIMIGYIMGLSTFFNSPDAGIGASLAMLFKMFAGLNPYVFIIVALALAVLLTNFANNVMICIAVMPVLTNYCVTVGMDPNSTILLLMFMTMFAIVTPAASPITAIAMTQEMVTPAQFTKVAAIMLPILFLVGIAVGYPLSGALAGIV